MGYRVVENEEQPVLPAGAGSRTRVLAAASTGAACMSVAERWVDPGAEVPLHRHPEGVEEAIWVRSGEAELHVGEETVVVGRDTTVVIPPLTWHSFRAGGSAVLYVFSRWSAPVPLTVSEGGVVGESEVAGASDG